MDENVKNQLDQLGNIIDEKIEKAAGQALESATGKADSALKGEIDNLTKKFNESITVKVAKVRTARDFLELI